MILQSLVDYYAALAARGEIARPGWSLVQVSFALHIAPSGALLSITPLKQEVLRGKKTTEVPQSMLVPERVVRSAGIKPNFLCDTAGYLLGFDTKGKPQRTLECFEACKQHHLSILEGATGAAAGALRAFFQSWDAPHAAEHPVLQEYAADLQVANLVFMVGGGDYAHKDPELQDCWQRYSSGAGAEKQSGICLVTGKKAPIAVLHGKIKGLPGGQAAGTTLVGFNAPAYESYGRRDAQGLNAPVGEYAAFAYVTALNHLLADREHRCQIGDTTVVYWAEQADPKPPEVFNLFFSPEEDTDSLLAGVLQNLAQGKPVDDVDLRKRFYVLGVAPNAARVSVRFFVQDTFGGMLQNLRRHYERLEIERPAFDHRQYLSVWALLSETVNPNSRDKSASPLLAGAVMRSILTGARYPQALFAAVLTRIRADHNLSRGRAAIIKAYLMRNHNEQEVTTMALNPDSDNRAYVLGRLFALLEDAQLQANPGINTTIKDRYFASACATPGSVFPQLLRLSHHHTAKDEKSGRWREKEKGLLLDKLHVDDNPFPAHLSLADQGIFMLGYYHQVQVRYRKKEDK